MSNSPISTRGHAYKPFQRYSCFDFRKHFNPVQRGGIRPEVVFSSGSLCSISGYSIHSVCLMLSSAFQRSPTGKMFPGLPSSCISWFPSPYLDTNWPFCVDVSLHTNFSEIRTWQLYITSAAALSATCQNSLHWTIQQLFIYISNEPIHTYFHKDI